MRVKCLAQGNNGSLRWDSNSCPTFIKASMDIYLFFGALKKISCWSTCMPRLSRCLNRAGLINNLKYTNIKDFWF